MSFDKEPFSLSRFSLSMKLTEEILLKDLELLRHGGAEAISLFMEMAGRMRQAADDALHDWVTLALPALPERERAEIVVLLMVAPRGKRRLH
jgi:hypothetical protein